MPAEKFYNPQCIADEEYEPAHADRFDVTWPNTDADGRTTVVVAGVPLDRSGVNRLIRTLRRARDRVYGADA